MVKNNLNDIFSDLDNDSSLIIPKSIKIKNIKSVDIISNNISSNIPQKGGQFTGSIKRNNKDIKHLISMLSATSDNNSTDNTEQLKDQLYNILEGGNDKKSTFRQALTNKLPLPKFSLISVEPIQSESKSLSKHPHPFARSDRGDRHLPISSPEEGNDHTHIIYTCCLIDENVVRKLAELRELNNNNGKITRIYMNINPFNIWGTAANGIAFGENYYKGTQYLHELFILGGLLQPNRPVSYDENYEASYNFILYLRENNIIVFDSADFLLKPFLFDENITIDDAKVYINNSTLLKNQVEKDKLSTFLDNEVIIRTKIKERIVAEAIIKEKVAAKEAAKAATKTDTKATAAKAAKAAAAKAATAKAKNELEKKIMIKVPYEWYREHLGNIWLE